MVPKKIVLIGPARPYRGGIAQFTDAAADGLFARGHDVEIVTFRRQYPKVLFPGKSQLEPGRSRPDAPVDGARGRDVPGDRAGVMNESGDRGGVVDVPGDRGGMMDVPGTIDVYGTDSDNPSPSAAEAGVRLIDSLNPVSWVRTARHLLRRAPDVIVIQYWMPFFAPAFGTIARLVRGRSTVLAIVHNAIPHERRWGDVALGKFFFRQCAGFLALSDAVAQDLRSLAIAGEIRTAAHPVYEHFGPARPREEARRRLGIDREDEVLLFFGFIRKYKGLETLLEAMPAILRARPKARLVIAGEFYDDEAPYRSAIRRLGIAERILIHPKYIPAEEVSDYFSAANLVVQPYESATQSGVVQTAFHFERPVVVTDVGGLAEVVPDATAGFVVPARDPEALAGAVIRFFEAELEAQFSEGVRAERERYSWESLLEALEELIDSTARI